MQLYIRMQDPTLGKGWYKGTVPTHLQTDEEVLRWMRSAYPDATRVQVIREYDLEPGARA